VWLPGGGSVGATTLGLRLTGGRGTGRTIGRASTTIACSSADTGDNYRTTCSNFTYLKHIKYPADFHYISQIDFNKIPAKVLCCFSQLFARPLTVLADNYHNKD